MVGWAGCCIGSEWSVWCMHPACVTHAAGVPVLAPCILNMHPPVLTTHPCMNATPSHVSLESTRLQDDTPARMFAACCGRGHFMCAAWATQLQCGATYTLCMSLLSMSHAPAVDTHPTQPHVSSTSSLSVMLVYVIICVSHCSLRCNSPPCDHMSSRGVVSNAVLWLL